MIVHILQEIHFDKYSDCIRLTTSLHDLDRESVRVYAGLSLLSGPVGNWCQVK